MEEDEFSAMLRIGPDSRIGVHRREKNSFRGISTRKSLRILTASAVNQDFLDEICELHDLEDLTLEWPVTAETLEGLAQLDGFAFEKLTLTNVTVVDKDLSPLITCRKLKTLRCAKSISTFEGFMALADARPDMACDWFSPDNWPGRKWKR